MCNESPAMFTDDGLHVLFPAPPLGVPICPTVAERMRRRKMDETHKQK